MSAPVNTPIVMTTTSRCLRSALARKDATTLDNTQQEDDTPPFDGPYVERPERPKIKGFDIPCCFCWGTVGEWKTDKGGHIEEEPGIYSVILIWPDGSEQTWWCHRECFVDALHEGARYMRDERKSV